MEQQKKRWKFVILTLIIFFLVSIIISSIFSLFIASEPFGNVAVIPVKGIIRIDGGKTFGAEIASSTEITKQIQNADEKSSIKAILLDINSPGGSAVASKEIATAIKRTNKTTVAVIREVGASGGYWIASAADYIIADEMSITGSIGVLSSYIEFAGLLERYNMTYQQLTAGKYKEIGNPFRPLKQEEKEILQKKIDKIHSFFIQAIAENRNMPEKEVRQLATGEFYLGIEAFESGLIDSLGDKETAKSWLQQELNLTTIEFAEYKTKRTLLDALSSLVSPQSFLIGKGIGAALKETNNAITIIT